MTTGETNPSPTPDERLIAECRYVSDMAVTAALIHNVPISVTLALQRAFNTLDRCASRLSAFTSPAWRPIADAPRDGTPILLYFPKRYQGKGGVSWGCFVEEDWLDSRAIRDNDCTHFMLLPPPPSLTPDGE